MTVFQKEALPLGWQTVRLKWLLSALESGRREISDSDDFTDGALSIGGEHIGWNGRWLLENPRYVSREFISKMSTGIIQKDDVLLVKDGATIGKALIAEQLPAEEAAVNEHVFILRFLKDECSKFFFYFIQSSLAQDQIWLEVRGSAQPGLNSEFCSTVIVPKPPQVQQHKIAVFLDQETTRIDSLVAAKERLLEIMDEKRRALITHTITRGLNLKAPLRDSGIPWLGKIPTHWETERTKWLFTEREERSETGEEEMLTVSHITGVTPRSEKNVNMFEAETTEGYKVCYAGDLVINTLWAWMGAMGVSPMHGIVSPAYHVYTPCERLAPAYIDALVRMPIFAEEAIRYSKGVWSSRLRLYPENFFEIWLPVPPLDEQRALVAHIGEETKKIDLLREAAERTIGLLKERRAALIAAVVTGKINCLSAFAEGA